MLNITRLDFWLQNNTIPNLDAVVYLQNMRKSRPILTDVYNIYLQYQTCIDMDTIMTHWEIPPIVGSCIPFLSTHSSSNSIE